MTDPSFPSPEPIKSTTETLTTFIRWLADLVLTKNWISLLVLLDLAAVFLLKPESGILLKLLKANLTDWYEPVFWLGVAAIAVIAVGVAIKTAPRPLKLESADEGTRTAIKGLRSFGVEDAEIFAKLQRNQSLQDCLASIARPEFRFGILVGESGCGKSSLLQAGVIPKLRQSDAPLRGVYVKFSDRAPIPTIRAALVEQLSIPASRLEQTDFLTLLAIATEGTDRPLVLLFDQFEQFFVHQPKKSDREPFIQALTQWYTSPTPLPVKIVVSIRADLQYELNPLQQALGYILTRYEIFQLEKFDPEEATEVLRVLADSEQLDFDKRFVEELTQSELTSSEGKVSPVDLQIVAEIVRKQRKAEQRAFNREAFQKLGGIDGLLNRYLEDTLDDLRLQGHTSLYQTALQVLLALTDRERNVRSNVLTLDDLQAALIGIATPREIVTAIDWLASGAVRLITPVEHQQQPGYELAHERIIPALLRLAGKELKEADRANHLLERRTQEWVGNQRQPRYLLNWRELRLIHKYKTQLTWGSHRRAKEQLLQQSWKRVYIALWTLGIALALLLAGWITWLTPPMQQRYATWSLEQRSAIVRYEIRTDAALAFAKNSQWKRATVIANSMQSDPSNEAQTLNQIATIAITLKDPAHAKALLEEARTTAEKIQDDRSKSDVLIAIVESYGKLNDSNTAKTILEQALTSAKNLPDEFGSKSDVLRAIAESYGKLNDSNTVKAGLAQVLISAKNLQDDFSKYSVLSAIAESYGKLNDSNTAKTISEQALTSAKNIQDHYYKSFALSNIAASYGKLNDTIIAKTRLVGK
jgi:hypothetical protein